MVDFIEISFINFPVFNVADIAITVGAVMVLMYFIKDLIKDLGHNNDSVKAYADEVIELAKREQEEHLKETEEDLKSGVKDDGKETLE